MATLDDLLDLDRELATGNGETYRRLCLPQAVFVLPGMMLDLEQCAEAMDSSPGWDEVDISDGRLLPAGQGGYAVVYTFVGRRGQDVYRATMTTLYLEHDGEPRAVLHQQTPLG
ncbi:hypothetical protein [Georgenia halophila]